MRIQNKNIGGNYFEFQTKVCIIDRFLYFNEFRFLS